MIYKFLKFILSPLIKLIWVKDVRGLENIPKKGGFILAANHSSYLDFFVLSILCPRRVYFMAGEIFFKKNYWSWLMKLTGQIKVDRNLKDKTSSLLAAAEVLKRGDILGIFPEGTRSSTGMIQKAYDGVGRLAFKNSVPVLPVGLIGFFNVMSRFDRVPKLNKNCEVSFGEIIVFHDYQDDHELTVVVMKAIAVLSKQKYQYE